MITLALILNSRHVQTPAPVDSQKKLFLLFYYDGQLKPEVEIAMQCFD